jgi:hypothetical protein
MRSFWERVFYYRDITPGRIALVVLEGACMTIVAIVVLVGTLVNFSLPDLGMKSPGGCYFTDALIVFIECANNPLLGGWLSHAWLSTWGILWLIGLVPYSLIFLVPEVAIVWLAARLLRRLSF